MASSDRSPAPVVERGGPTMMARIGIMRVEPSLRSRVQPNGQRTALGPAQAEERPMKPPAGRGNVACFILAPSDSTYPEKQLLTALGMRDGDMLSVLGLWQGAVPSLTLQPRLGSKTGRRRHTALHDLFWGGKDPVRCVWRHHATDQRRSATATVPQRCALGVADFIRRLHGFAWNNVPGHHGQDIGITRRPASVNGPRLMNA